MARKTFVQALVVGIMTALAVPSFAAGRLNDKAVEQQGKQIKAGFETWKKALEKKNLDDAVIRGAAGTIEVKEFLKNFERDISTFNERFQSTKSAGPEALTLLRRASDVERRASSQQGSAVPSEWQAFSRQCAVLAGAYGVVWPIEAMDATASRLGDKEVAGHIEQIGQLAKRVKGPADDAAKKSTTVDKAARETMKLEFESVARLAGEAANKVKSGSPVSAEVSQLLAVTSSVHGKIATLSLPQAAANDWSGVDRAAAIVAGAFGEHWGLK
ncbi:MAG: hypothetical protein NTY02_03205 [Acidobacteria bacterium]|nr:hypothetical protein [Acidobacteriota bacterium]